MSKPALTIITTPASAPATQPPTPAQDISPSIDQEDDSSPLRSPPDDFEHSLLRAQESPQTDEVIGTPGLSHPDDVEKSERESKEADKVKAWSSTISSSESVPVGLRLPPIPDAETLDDLYAARSTSKSASPSPTESSGRFPFGKGDATRSLPSLKDTALQQKQQQATRGRSPLAQANTSGPAVSPASSPKPTGFKAFLKKTFGIGKSSSDKRRKDKSPAGPSSLRAQTPRSPAPISQSPATTTQPNEQAPFTKVSATRSPPALATPVFSPVPPSPLTQGTLDKHFQSSGSSQPSDSNLSVPPPQHPAQIPLPPSPLVEQDSPRFPTSATVEAAQCIDSPPTRHSQETDHSEGTTLTADTVPEGSLTVVETRNSSAEHSSSEATHVNTAGRGSNGDKATDIPAARASPGRAGIRTSPSKIMSAIEPHHPNPFGTSPVNTSHINAGMIHTGAAQLRGGVTMSRSVTAEGMQEAEEIMGGKELALQQASKKLAASVEANPRQADDDEDEEAKDFLGFDLVIPSRTLARKVSPTSTNGIPKYGRSTSAPAGERLPPPSENGHDRFGRKPSVKGPIGGGLARSGSKLRTSVYGLADVLHRKDTTPQQKRISASPTIHTMDTIRRQADEICDQEERDRAESFFMS